MASHSVSSLQTDELDEALVLARLGHACFDEAAWHDQVVALVADDRLGGALIARDGSGRPSGLMVYRITRTPDQRPSLEVLKLVAFDLLNPGLIADVLVEEAVRLARLQNCETLRLVRPLNPSADTLALVLASGVADLHSVF